MSTNKLQLPVSGFPQGLNTEASVLNVLPSEFMDGTINVELLPNGSVRRRRGVNFISIGDTGNVIHEIVSGLSVEAETDGFTTSAIYAKLTAPNGTLIERVVVFINNEFRIYKIDPISYGNFDIPFQTIKLVTPAGQQVTKIPGTEGAAIGDMTGGGGLAAAFDNDTNQIDIDCASIGGTATEGFIGKDWGSGNTKTITSFKAIGSSNKGFVGDQDPTIQITLQGSTDNFVTSVVDLGEISATDANGLILTKSTGIDISTPYRYHRLRIAFNLIPSTGGRCAEVEFFEDTDIFKDDAGPDQKYYNVSFTQSGEKLYFAGRHLIPGWLEVDNDNISLKKEHIDVIIRNPNAAETNTRVTRNNKWFECIEAHTSSAVNSPGDGTGDWQNFWIVGQGPTPTGLSAWATATSYTTTMVKRYNKDISVTNFNFYPTQVAFYAGRIWLAGDVFFPNSVYFSQVIQTRENINRFHTQADPFDTNDSQVIDSDGGVFNIQGIGLIFQLVPVNRNLYVGTNIGVSQITGAAGDVFKATSFSQQTVLNDRVGGSRNIVRIDQEIIVFAESSIWLSQTETSIASSTLGQATFANITDGRLTTLYDNIPRENKFSGHAIYNPTRREVIYLFNRQANTYQTTRNIKEQPNYFTHALIVDTRFLEETGITGTLNQTEGALRSQNVIRLTKGAFYLYEFPDNGLTGKPFITTVFISPELLSADNQVIDSLENTVIDGTSNLVVATGTVRERIGTNIIAMSRDESGGLVIVKAAFGNFQGTQLRDWELDNDTTGFAQSYASKINFGTMTLGDIGHFKGGAYLTLIFKIVIDGSAFLRYASDFSINALSTKFGDQVQVYFPDRFGATSITGGTVGGHDHTWFKHRIRTRSRAMQFILENDADKDFHLIGYNYQFWNKGD